MPNNHQNPNGPTPQYNPPSSPGKQEKLVLGSFKGQSGSSQRQPYQYPPAPPQARNAPPQQSPAMVPPPQRYPQQAPPGMVPPPNAAPQGNRYPYPQPGPGQKNGMPNFRKRRRAGCLTALVIMLLVGVLSLITMQRALAFGSAISPESPLSTQTGYMTTDQRTNLLVLGFGGEGHDGAYLTDSEVVISLMPQNHHTSLISVPRDLWVSYPDGTANRTKINAIYTDASNNNQDPIAGGNAVADKIQKITGLDKPYWMTVNFAGFRNLIDSLGGIDVYVPDSFNACYPKNDNADVDPTWIKVQFNQGSQHMDGATAIQYARAREPLAVCGMGQSENMAELTDFGRSARQQIIIKATLAKFKQVTAWPHLFSAMDALKKAIYTNMSLADLTLFTMSMDLNDPQAAHIGLSNANVLEDMQANDGEMILMPKNEDWTIIPPYIQQHLYN